MKCEICGKEILRDSQCINYKYYHNDCIEQLQQENKQLKDNIRQMDNIVDKLQKQLIKEKDNWNELKEDLINDINNRNGNRDVEYEDSRKVSETISPIYTLMEDKSKIMKEVLDKMQEMEKNYGNVENNT